MFLEFIVLSLKMFRKHQDQKRYIKYTKHVCSKLEVKTGLWKT